MISQKMQAALNKQINEELYSSYLYLSMAAYFAKINYTGFSLWMKKQSEEEYEHAMKIYDYILEIGAEVNLNQINEPKKNWVNSFEVFEESLAHELHITKCINELADLAVEEKDHATNIFLHWFVQEQVEEVAAVTDIVNKFKLIGDNQNGVFMLDRELAKR